jgi:hypothetical protein
MIARGSDCARHREALAALAERREPSPAGHAALDHVECCRGCSEALGELILTVFALRRLASEAAAATAHVGAQPDDAWTRLRIRIDRSRRLAREQAWRWRATLGGLATASLLVAAVVGPATIQVTADSDSGPAAITSIQLDRLDWRIELGYVNASRTLTPDSAPGSEELGGGNVTRTMFPDGIRPARKEVQPGRPTTRLPEAG